MSEVEVIAEVGSIEPVGSLAAPLQQLGDVGSNPPRLVAAVAGVASPLAQYSLGRCCAARLQLGLCACARPKLWWSGRAAALGWRRGRRAAPPAGWDGPNRP